MNAEAILARFQCVRRNRNGCYVARCPAHADNNNPSLSIREVEGRVLLNCFAGCTVEAICAAARIEKADLFSDGAPAPRVVATYDYSDEVGALLYQVVRYEPKGFRQRRPDGSGGWTWNLQGIRRVLYRLPEVLAAGEVLVCEGEKDCETARGMGLVATCNSQGAGKWRPEYPDFLEGKRVCIVADADAPGRKHAQGVAASLWGRVESLRVMEVPGAKDLTEWFEHGGRRETFLDLVKNTIEWKPAIQNAGGFALTPLGDLLARPDAPVEYLVENLLVAGTVSCVAAKPKVGKSTFARNLGLAVSRGEDFLNLKTKQGECVYLALEEREEDIKNDFKAMGADGSEPIYIYAAAAPAEGIAALCDLIRERRPLLVVIDPLFRLARIRDEKAYAETYAALGPLIDVAREAGTHVLLTHHAGKSEKADPIDAPLGSTAIGGAVCTLIHLKRSESMRTIQSVQRIGLDIPETVLQFDLESRCLSLGEEKAEADMQTAGESIFAFLRDVGESKTEVEIGEVVEGRTGIKRKALRALVTQAKIIREGGGRKGEPYRYRFSFSCSQDMEGTTERESEKWPDSHTNSADILVPSISCGEQRDADLGEQAFLDGTL